MEIWTDRYIYETQIRDHDLGCCYTFVNIQQFSSIQFNLSVVFDSLQPHEPQQARPPCSSPTPGVFFSKYKTFLLPISCRTLLYFSFPGGSVVKNLPARAGDMGLIHGLGRSPGEGNGNPLQYSCLENFMDRGAWWAAVHRITKNQT